MRKAFLLLGIWLLLFSPIMSRAAFYIPSASLKIITNTTGPDGVFSYVMHQGIFASFAWHTTTIGGVGEYILPNVPAWPSTYVLSQEFISDYVQRVNCNTSNQSSSFVYYEHSTELTLGDQDSVTCIVVNTPKASEATNSVLILPGIMGTQMVKGGDKLWPDTSRMIFSADDRFMDPLRYLEQGQPLDSSVIPGAVISKEPKFDYSGSLLDDIGSLISSKGASVNTFPYDWRKDVRDVAVHELRAKIDELAPEGSGKKLDVVGHSQGGLVVKYLLYALPQYRSRIGKLIFVGTPHLGAPKAAKALLYGDSMGVSLLGLGLDPEEIKRISQNMPSVYGLLPSKEYFNHEILGYLGATEKTGLLGVEKVARYNFDDTKQVLAAKGLNANLIAAADGLHSQTFDTFDLTTVGVDAYNIVGCQEASVARLYTRSNGKYKLEYGPGDGTVPAISASNVGVGHTYYALKTEHGTMLTGVDTRNQILGILRGELGAATPKITTNASDCRFNGRQVSVHSPVELHVYDSQGNHVGPAPQGGFDYEIPGVQYDVIGEEKFAYLPSGEQYKIQLIATDTGVFDLYNEPVGNDTHRTTYFHAVPLTSTTTGQLQVNGAVTSAISLDVDANGSVDKTVLPTTTIDGVSAEDLLAPKINILLKGEGGMPGWYRSEVLAEVGFEDVAQEGASAVGILEKQCRLDAGEWKTYTKVIKVRAEGSHVLECRATDKIGNVSTERRAFWIDATPPEAVFTFDPETKNVQVRAEDALDPHPVVEDALANVRIADAAGNTLQVEFAEKDRARSLRAQLTSLSYNSRRADIPRNGMLFLWSLDRNGQLQSVDQTVYSKKEYYVLANYRNGKTTVVSLDRSGIRRKTYPNLHLVSVRTRAGDLVWATE